MNENDDLICRDCGGKQHKTLADKKRCARQQRGGR